MKLISSTFYIYKEEYFFLQQVLKEIFNELSRKENENKTQYCRRLKDSYPISFENVKRYREVDIVDNLRNSLAILFPNLFRSFYDDEDDADDEVDYDCNDDYEKLFINNSLIRLELKLYKANKTETYSSFSKYLSVKGTLLLREIIEKNLIENSGINEVSESKEFLEKFRQFFEITVDCPYGIELNVRQAKKISCEDKFANLFTNKPQALFTLGCMYYYGEYVEKNYSKAFDCFEKAVELGCSSANEYLSWMYFYGEGTEKNYSKAKELHIKDMSPEFKLLNKIFGEKYDDDLEKAVEKNNAEAQIRIGDYFKKVGDYSKALEWYKMAAEQGNSDAKLLLGLMYKKQKDTEKSIECYKKAAEQGNSNAQVFIGYAFLVGEGLEKNYKEAKKWYEKAAESNNSMAQYYIGRLYYEGRGVERSYEKAFEWIEKATINGSQEAKNFLPDLKNYLLPIMVAAKDNSIDTVKKLISTGLDVNAVYEQGMTALMVATIFNSVDVARFLIDAGADINTADIQARTPLMLAAIYNSIDVARLLIERGADINMTLKSEREEWLYRKRNIVPRNTPLMFAAIHNSVDVAKVLIEKGASVNVKVNIARDYRNRIPERDVSALEFAVRHNSIDIVKLFHDKKIESNNNILLYASRYDNIDIAKLAIEFGARKIINTVEENSPAIVKLLIDSGFHYGKTAFKFAVSHNLVPIAKLLLDAGADLIDDTVVRNKQHWKKSNIQFEFHPRNENVFKRLFILIGEAYRFFYLKNLDEPIFNIWHLTSFSMDSNLKACIFASTCYRENRTKGLYKIKLKIPGCEKYDDYSLEQVDQELEKIYQDVQQQQSNTHTKAINIINSQDKSSKQNENNSTENDSACVAAEEQYEIGLEFYKEKIYEKALKHFSKAAEKGIVGAQIKLGDMYYYGDCGEPDYKKAFENYSSAAQEDNETIQYKLGLLYLNGEGTEQSFEHAINCFKKSAAKNNSEAQFELGNIYEKGLGVKQDYKEAEVWYKKATNTGHKEAKNRLGEVQYQLGLLYFCGDGVPRDFVEAKKWFEKAYMTDNGSATYFLSCMYYNGDGTDVDKNKSRWLFEKASEQCKQQEIMKLEDLYYKYRNVTEVSEESEKKEIKLPSKKKKVVIIKKT